MPSDPFAKIIRSSTFMRIAIIFGFLFIAFVIFEFGVLVGFSKAGFDHSWQDNYAPNFGTFSAGPFARHLPNPHGAYGTIVDVSLPTFTIVGPSEDEKMVRVSSTTIIRRDGTTASPTEITQGEAAIIIGQPDTQGVIDAMFIRLSPASSTVMTNNP